MSMRLAIGFVLIGVSLVVWAVRSSLHPVLIAALMLPSTAFVLVGIAYAGVGPGIFGKSPDGRLSRINAGLLWPYLLVNECLWWLTITTVREPSICQIADSLYCGRRLTRRDTAVAIEHQFHGCLDLTAEFTETDYLRQLPNYRCLQLLDRTAPTLDQLRDAVDWLIEATAQGPVYVHCALGHGRTGTIVIAYLIETQLEPDIASALASLQRLRWGVGINRDQQRILQQFVQR